MALEIIEDPMDTPFLKGNVIHLTLKGSLAGKDCTKLEDLCNRAIKARQKLLIDVKNLTDFDENGRAILLRAMGADYRPSAILYPKESKIITDLKMTGFEWDLTLGDNFDDSLQKLKVPTYDLSYDVYNIPKAIFFRLKGIISLENSIQREDHILSIFYGRQKRNVDVKIIIFDLEEVEYIQDISFVIFAKNRFKARVILLPGRNKKVADFLVKSSLYPKEFRISKSSKIEILKFLIKEGGSR